eukprot:g20814.t1
MAGARSFEYDTVGAPKVGGRAAPLADIEPVPIAEASAEGLQCRGGCLGRFHGEEPLPASSKRNDPFAGMVLGPFNYWIAAGVTSKWYWDIEGSYPYAKGGILYERPQNARVLELDTAMQARDLQDFKRQVEGITRGFVDDHPVQSDAGRRGVLQDGGSSMHSVHSEHTPLTGFVKGRSNAQAEIEVNRLPWNLVSFITRVLQLVWVGLGVMGALRETNAVIFDFQRSYIVEERRLQEAIALEPLEVPWPHAFFRPEHLTSCDQPHRLLISSPFAHFELQDHAGDSLHLVNTTDGNQISVQLPDAHRFYAGSLLPCSALDILASEPRCLLMLSSHQSKLLLHWTTLSQRGSHLRWRSPLEFNTSQGSKNRLAAVHLVEGQLWALFSDGRLEHWELLGHEPERLAQHKVTWEERSRKDPFEALGLCVRDVGEEVFEIDDVCDHHSEQETVPIVWEPQLVGSGLSCFGSVLFPVNGVNPRSAYWHDGTERTTCGWRYCPHRRHAGGPQLCGAQLRARLRLVQDSFQWQVCRILSILSILCALLGHRQRGHRCIGRCECEGIQDLTEVLWRQQQLFQL